MYKVYLDDKLIWSPESDRRKLLNPKVQLEVNKAGSLSFKILPDHPQYNSFVRMRSIVTVVQDHRTIFKGRVYSTGRDFQTIKPIKAEGILAYFNDSIVAPYTFTGTPAEYLSMLIDQHNAQVADHQKFILGNVTVTDPNDYITRASSDRLNTWKEINSKLIEKLGGYICIRYESGGNYIDYLADYTDTSTQKIKFAVNLLDLDQVGSADELITCLIPFGAKDEETGKRVDITSVNNGIEYVMNEDAVAQYGKIFDVKYWDDVTVPANLLRKAAEYLSQKVVIPEKLTIKVIDLHLTDDRIESFKLGDYVQILSKPHDIDTTAMITAYSIDISDPVNAVITIGITRNSYLADVSRDNIARSEEIRKEISDSTSSISDQVLKQTENYILNQIESAESVTREMIRDRVTQTELNQYKEQVSSQFTQSSEDLSLSIRQINARITEENGEINQQISDINKYFKFTIDGLEIGVDADNTIKLVLDNDIIKFTKNGQTFGYWDGTNFHTGNLLVDVNERAQFGDFAFIPRSDGSLMFLKVSGEVAPDPDPLDILTQSDDTSGNVGDVVNLYVTASGDNVRYQWQINSSGSWSNISGQTMDTLNLTLAQNMNGYKYRCVISDNSGESMESEPIVISVVIPFTWSVDAVSGATYGFQLNSNGYYESTNKGVQSSYALARVNFTAGVSKQVRVSFINYAEANYDYGLFGKLDTALEKSTGADSTAVWNGQNYNNASVQTITYTIPTGSHYFDVKYRKDGSQDSNNDSLQFRIEVL